MLNKEEIEKAKKIINKDIKKLNIDLNDDSYTDQSLEEIRYSEKVLMNYIEKLENKVKERHEQKQVVQRQLNELETLAKGKTVSEVTQSEFFELQGEIKAYKKILKIME